MRRAVLATLLAVALVALNVQPAFATATYRYKACNEHQAGGGKVHLCITADVRKQADGTGVEIDQFGQYGYGPDDPNGCSSAGTGGWEHDPAVTLHSPGGATVYDMQHTNVEWETGTPNLYGYSCNNTYLFNGQPDGVIRAPWLQVGYSYTAHLDNWPDPDVVELQIDVRIGPDGNIQWWCDNQESGRSVDICTRRLL